MNNTTQTTEPATNATEPTAPHGPFYVTTRENVGPNASDARNNNSEPIATITTEMPRTNGGGREMPDGWLGQTNDWTVHSWGEFETMDAARAYCHAQGYTEAHEDENADEGAENWTTRRATLDHYDAGDWFQNDPDAETTPQTTDEELEKMVERYEAEALNEGAEVAGILEYLTERRDAQRNDE